MLLAKSLRRFTPARLSLARALSTDPKELTSYTERMARTGRPVSPHVTIYAFPITAVSSVMNRFTGVALCIGVYGIAGSSLLGLDVVSLTNALGNSLIGPLAKMAVSFPLVYHYLGGVRHIVWDNMPSLLETKDASTSSYLIIGGSAVIALGLAFVKF